MEGRLLLVDDEVPVLDVLSEYFVAQGYDVRTATSGHEALKSLGEGRPDLVLLDIRMPGLDGVEVLKRLRAAEATLPVIMVTANEDVDLARRTLQLGAFDYVAKPFDFAYLERAVAAALLHATGGFRERPAAADPWTALALAVFRATREMPAEGRRAVGERLEQAALAAARHAAAGRPDVATEQLGELELLLGVGGELGDLGALARDAVATAVMSARRALTAG